LTGLAAASAKRLNINPKRQTCKMNSGFSDEIFKESEPHLPRVRKKANKI